MKLAVYNVNEPSCLKPEVTEITSNTINQSTTTDIIIKGFYFDTSSIVLIGGTTVNSTTFINSGELLVNVTSGATGGLYDVLITNLCGSQNFTDAFEIKVSIWVDLRQDGNTLTHGNTAGNDIKYKVGMSMIRSTDGMSFNGANPWSSWVKFESLSWQRGEDKTLQWIFTAHDNAFMIGISSDAADENANDQYKQGEVHAYFYGVGTPFWGLYGNNGTPGNPGNQANIVAINGTIYKVKFEGDGNVGEQFTLYQLPSSDPSDWDNEDNVLATLVIGGSLNPQQTNIMPVIIPRTGGNQKFIALKVE